MLDIYAAREDPVPGITSELITSRVNRPGGYAPDADLAVQDICRRAQPGDIILTVGAGDVTQYGAHLVRELAGSDSAPAAAGDNGGADGEPEAAAAQPVLRKAPRG